MRIKQGLTAGLLALMTLWTVLPVPAAATAADGRIDLAAGNHVRWVDRMELPDYAKSFYAALEEGTDNDGVDDFLIEDKYFSYGTTDINAFLNESPKLFTAIQTPEESAILFL